jgi:ADP-heptose:LPS heptosyltransferase
MKSILIKLPNWIGDILFSFDLLYSLSKSFERMVFLTSLQHSELFRIFPISGSEVIEYEPEEWPWLKSDTLNRIRQTQIPCGLLLPNSIGSAVALRRAGLSELFGYNTEHRGFLLKHKMDVPHHRMHQTEYYLELLKLFQLEARSYPVSSSEPKERIVVLHPGASKMERAWNLERFIQLAEALREKELQVLFVSGKEISVGSFPLKVKPSLTEFSNLLRSCSVFVGNDSGPLHLAQQCGAPVIGIYGPGDPMTTGPRSVTAHRVIYHSYPCSPCRQNFFKECDPAPSGKPYCIETISTHEVLQATLELLATDPHG